MREGARLGRRFPTRPFARETLSTVEALFSVFYPPLPPSRRPREPAPAAAAPPA